METKKTYKSTFAIINTILNGIENKDYIIFGGIPEHETLTLAERTLSCIAERYDIPVTYIALKNTPSEQNTNVHVETGLSNIEQIEKNIKQQKKENNIKLAFIDCLTLIEHPEGIPALSEKLKMIASTEQISIMVVSPSTLETSKNLNPDALLQVLEFSNGNQFNLLVSSKYDQECEHLTLMKTNL